MIISQGSQKCFCLLFSLSKVKLSTETVLYCLHVSQSAPQQQFLQWISITTRDKPRSSHLWTRGCSCWDLLRRGEHKVPAAMALGTSSQLGLALPHAGSGGWAILAQGSKGCQSSSQHPGSFSCCAFLSQKRSFPEHCSLSQKTKPGTGSSIWKQETTAPSYLH